MVMNPLTFLLCGMLLIKKFYYFMIFYNNKQKKCKRNDKKTPDEQSSGIVFMRFIYFCCPDCSVDIPALRFVAHEKNDYSLMIINNLIIQFYKNTIYYYK